MVTMKTLGICAALCLAAFVLESDEPKEKANLTLELPREEIVFGEPLCMNLVLTLPKRPTNLRLNVQDWAYFVDGKRWNDMASHCSLPTMEEREAGGTWTERIERGAETGGVWTWHIAWDFYPFSRSDLSPAPCEPGVHDLTVCYWPSKILIDPKDSSKGVKPAEGAIQATATARFVVHAASGDDLSAWRLFDDPSCRVAMMSEGKSTALEPLAKLVERFPNTRCAVYAAIALKHQELRKMLREWSSPESKERFEKVHADMAATLKGLQEQVPAPSGFHRLALEDRLITLGITPGKPSPGEGGMFDRVEIAERIELEEDIVRLYPTIRNMDERKKSLEHLKGLPVR